MEMDVKKLLMQNDEACTIRARWAVVGRLM